MTREEYRALSTGELVNNGTVKELRLQVEEMMERELKPRGIRYISLLSSKIE